MTSAPQPEIAQIVADWRGDAAVLRRRGDARAAELLERCAAEATDAADEYTTMLTEADAAKRSGWSSDRVRRHARLFLSTPHVTYDTKTRHYRLRACVVPRRAHLEMVRADAARAS